ncbi:MAG: hypothetical protein JKY86_08590 [Gammaproteobacteria bacterium]|nr:hypothetical protein [Gammaproteobacteria bacterium]
MTVNELSFQNTKDVIRESLFRFSDLFVHIHKHKGSLVLPRELINHYTNVEQPPWASYYESQEKMDTIALLVFIEPEDVASMAKELRSLPSEEVQEYKAELESQYLDMFKDMDETELDFDIPSAKEIKEYQKTTSLEQQQKDILTAYFLFTTFILQTYQFIALVTHGRSMHDLVRLAMEGDDIAFCQAVQIDRTLLFANPYFQKRLTLLQLKGKQSQLDELARFMKHKLYGEKYDSPELWIAFSILNRTGYLKSMPLDDLLDLCLDLNVYSGNNTKAIGKQRSKFLKRQRLLK